jgi:hypothetical protein
MSKQIPPTEQSQIVNFAGQLIQQTSKVHFNLEQEFIFTTDDKIRICLTDHLSRMEKRTSWIAPLGVLLAILVVFPTTTFKSFIVSAETWEAIFIISAILSFVWFIKNLWQARVSTSMDKVIDDIKRTALTHEISNNNVIA